MKRIMTIMICVLVLLMGASVAEAGIGDMFTKITIAKVAGTILSGIFFILAIIFGREINRWRKVATKGKDFGVWLYESTRKDSPGGALITGEELDKGLKEAGEFGVAILGAVRNK